VNLSSIVQQLQAEQQHQSSARPAAAVTSSSGTSSTGSASSTSNPSTSEATITADDFLQLLVSELQNQDPTADTDPNEYVNQLVDVNSLQQLISINQEVGDIDPASTASGTTASSSAINAENPSTSLAPLSTQAAHAHASYTALQPQTESSGQPTGQSMAKDPFTPANAAAVLDSLPSMPGNSAIPESWRPKAGAGH
jgi:flagellar basal-body rod modification protein FlgD